MAEKLVGRDTGKKILQDALLSKEAEPMITTYGVKKNNYCTGLVQNEVTMDALFKK